MTPVRIAVIGCGLGGAALGLLLQKAGYQPTIYEQASQFLRVGAGIHLTPNLTRILGSVGLLPALTALGSQPRTFTSRDGQSGEVIAEMTLGQAAQDSYGAPYLTIHRGDFHAAMAERLRPGSVRFGKRLSRLDARADGVQLEFEDSDVVEADLVIGADGLSSVVRQTIAPGAQPEFAGQVAYRAALDPRDLPQPPPDDLTKWWLGERFVIGYYLTRARDQYYFVAGLDAPSWPPGVQWVPADAGELQRAFADFHPAARDILAAARAPTLWPLYERPPETVWSDGPPVLLGDACHPMRPHMAQGAAMAIEDAAVLVRCLQEYAPRGPQQVSAAYAHYQRTRVARTAQVQHISGENSWMRQPTDPRWVFEYDALSVPLA